MEFRLTFISAILLVGGSHALTENQDFGRNDAVSNQTATAYSVGVDMGIINPEKYPLESFERDERNIFKDLYKEYISLNYSQPINYQEWLILNNYGILSDTQESLFQRKIVKRSTADNKRAFINTVKKGDILISGRGIGGLVGHAAIMTSDYWVLEMPGGDEYIAGIPDNNRQVPKDKWFDEHASDWTTVYRNRDSSVAVQAARWADRHYYSPSGGATKAIHVTYMLFPTAFRSFNPSYCSKLVLQAFFYGTGSKQVIRDPKRSQAAVKKKRSCKFDCDELCQLRGTSRGTCAGSICRCTSPRSVVEDSLNDFYT